MQLGYRKPWLSMGRTIGNLVKTQVGRGKLPEMKSSNGGIAFFLCTILAVSYPVAMLADDRDPVQPHPPVVLSNSEVRFMWSQNTGVGHKLYVALPKSYHKSTRSYPLVILLDADYSFPIAKGVAEHLGDRKGLPEVLIVAIGYAGSPQYRVNRTRDYTPTRSEVGYAKEVQDKSGGGASFRSYLLQELIPTMKTDYRVDPTDITLVGHSYGGLFAAFLLLADSLPVQKLLLVSPSLWYDKRWIVTQSKHVKGDPTRRLSVYVASGAQEKGICADVKSFLPELKRLAGPDGRLLAEELQDEDHDTVFPAALSRGLRYLFETWKGPRATSSGASVQPGIEK